jgi:hypothetical protein
LLPTDRILLRARRAHGSGYRLGVFIATSVAFWAWGRPADIGQIGESTRLARSFKNLPRRCQRAPRHACCREHGITDALTLPGIVPHGRKKDVSTAHACPRGLGDQVNLALKNWKSSARPRQPNQTDKLIAAAQTLMIANT